MWVKHGKTMSTHNRHNPQIAIGCRNHSLKWVVYYWYAQNFDGLIDDVYHGFAPTI